MYKLLRLFIFEIRRLCSRKNLVVFCLVLMASLYLANSDVNDYERIVKYSTDFSASEHSTFKKMLNYTEYSKQGFRVIFKPSVESILFSNPVNLSALAARINAVVSLKSVIPAMIAIYSEMMSLEA